MIVTIFYFFCFAKIYESSSEFYFWHVSDFHLDPRYGSNSNKPFNNHHSRDIFLGDYDEVCIQDTLLKDR